jgi:hypothetical protein
MKGFFTGGSRFFQPHTSVSEILMVNHHSSDHLFQIEVRRHLFWITIGSIKFVIRNWH